MIPACLPPAGYARSDSKGSQNNYEFDIKKYSSGNDRESDLD